MNRPPKKTKEDRRNAVDRNLISLEMFKIKSKAEAGLPMPVLLPDGTDSGHTMTVKGIDSDTYRHGRAKNSRRMAEILGTEKPGDLDEDEWFNQQNDLKHQADISLLASLVSDWSFPDEFSHEAVLNLLLEAPTIANQVDAFAVNRARFFARPLTK